MSNSKDMLVLEAGTTELRLTHVERTGGRLRILACGSFVSTDGPSERSALEDQLVLDALGRFVSEQGWAGKDALCLLSGDAVASQYFDLPPLKGAALRQSVLLKLGQQLHFEVDEAVVDIRRVGDPSRDETKLQRVAAIACRRAAAELALAQAAQLRLNMRSVSSAPAALTLLAEKMPDEDKPNRAVLYVGERFTTLIVLNGRTPSVTSELPVAMADFTAALMRPIISGDDVIQLDERQAESLRDEIGIPDPACEVESLGITGRQLLPVIEPTLQKLTQQLTQWLTFAATQEDAHKVEHLTVVGPGADLPGLTDALAKRLNLKVEVRHWLEGLAEVSAKAAELSIEQFGAVVGAMVHAADLPELTPPDVRRRRTLGRVRRSTAFVGPVVAAAILGFAFLLDQVGDRIQSAYGSHQTSLADVQQLLGTNRKWQEERKRVEALERRFDLFAQATPCWRGLFKELCRLLPSELETTQLLVRSDEGDMKLTIEASVYTTPHGRRFDEVVEQTLLALERSPFFRRVQLKYSNGAPMGSDRLEAGSLSIELDLAYPRGGKGD